jgi:UPF0755 protein
MMYSNRPKKRTIPKRLLIILFIAVAVIVVATMAVRHVYFQELGPVTANTGQHAQLVTIERGSSAEAIAKQLEDAGLIRSAWAFKLYIGGQKVRDALQAGTYSISASQSVAQIVSLLTHGKVATNLVTVLPGQRLDQIRDMLLGYGYKTSDVDAALDPASYAGNPALVDKPAGASLEGYLYPDSYQKDSNTTPRDIVLESLNQMNKQLTPDLRDSFAKHGLSTYEGVTLASILEQEVSNQDDRAQAAQVFLKRLGAGMMLGSDVTAYYGSYIAHQKPSVLYDSPYNTRIHTGLPPTPISNVSARSLQAAAHPAATDWLYFVAGDDGVTHFTRTLEEHDAAAAQYCHKLCSQ